MDNQHRKISGYRELNQEEIDLMNEIKAQGEVLNVLVAKVSLMPTYSNSDALEKELWSRSAEVSIRTGVMQLVRAVALPA